MIDKLITFLKQKYCGEYVEYEGENDEGFYFKFKNQEKEYFEFRVLKSTNSINSNNVEMRKLGKSNWTHSGMYALSKLGAFV